MHRQEKIKILLANSYSLEKIFDNWKLKINPSHYLMGKIELENSGKFVVDIIPAQRHKWIDRLGQWLSIPYLDQQLRVLFKLNRYDILYFPYPLSNTKLVLLLKRLGFLKTPIVVLAHQSFRHSSWKDGATSYSLFSILLRQADRYAFFSKTLLDRTAKDIGLPDNQISPKFRHVRWGPDLSFYKLDVTNSASSTDFAISAGTIDRDYVMLAEAFRSLKERLKVFCTPEGFPSDYVAPANVEVDNSWVSYPVLMKEYLSAGFVIIPIKDEVKNRGNTYGLTVLFDALALGKPVLMTYHPYIDIDIERLNIGLWVKDNTMAGWHEQLLRMYAMRDEWPVMGENARRLAETQYNVEIFAHEMESIFLDLYERKNKLRP